MKLFYQLLGLVLGFIIGILTATSSLAVLGLYIYSTDSKRDKSKGVKKDYSFFPKPDEENPLQHGYESRSEAESVLDMLIQLIVETGSASVQDLKVSIGFNPTYADSLKGWRTLASATVSRVEGDPSKGVAPIYFINFPDPINL